MAWSELAWIVAAGLATGLGGLGLLLIRRPSDWLSGVLGFTAGVMLAATVFSLLVPALELGRIGAAGLTVLDRLVPHVHERFREHGHATVAAERRALLLLSALTIHNIPEGSPSASRSRPAAPSSASRSPSRLDSRTCPRASPAAPLLPAGRSRRAAVGFGAASGAVEPEAALLTVGAAAVVAALLPGALAFAAGAMLDAVVDELVPEGHARGHERDATLALVAGFAVKMTLDTAFG